MQNWTESAKRQEKQKCKILTLHFPWVYFFGHNFDPSGINPFLPFPSTYVIALDSVVVLLYFLDLYEAIFVVMHNLANIRSLAGYQLLEQLCEMPIHNKNQRETDSSWPSFLPGWWLITLITAGKSSVWMFTAPKSIQLQFHCQHTSSIGSPTNKTNWLSNSNDPINGNYCYNCYDIIASH